RGLSRRRALGALAGPRSLDPRGARARALQPPVHGEVAMRELDALVVGGGPAGSTAAIGLARAGLSVAVVEKTAFPGRKGSGEFIAGTTWPVLRDLGVGGELAAFAGPPVREVGLFAGDTTLAAPMPLLRAADPWGRAVGRDFLDAALLARAAAAGAAVLQP